MDISPEWVQAVCAVIATGAMLLPHIRAKLRRRQAEIKKTPS
jgi:hypothetical protein